MSKKGIDVSKYQGQIDWDVVKANGIEFAIIRAGFGTSTMDQCFTRNIQECIRVGMPVGAYWFIYGVNESDAIKNADKFHEILSQYKNHITMKVWCDLEYDTDANAKKKGVTLTKEIRTRMVVAFCERMKHYGYEVGNYTNKDYMVSKFNDLSQYPIWYARYDVTEQKVLSECKPMLWQYTSKGTVPGIKGDVDMNLMLQGEIKNPTPTPDTKMGIRDKLLEICNKELGVGEPSGEDKYIDWFNKNVLKTWGFAFNVAWCQIFATYTGVHAGLTNKEFPLTAGCDEGMNWFKNRGQWKNSLAYGGNYTPRKGDMVYYSSTHNQNDSTHVGWAESCSGNVLTVVEGNYSNKVKKRTIDLTDPYIIGYGIVRYPDESSETIPVNPLIGKGKGTGVALSAMRVRNGPSTGYVIVGNIPKGSSVEVLEQTDNEWLKIVWDGTEWGYAYVSNTKPYFEITWKEEPYKPKDAYEIGEVVQFNGGKHYTSSNAEKGYICLPGKARVSQYAKGAKHPYHLVSVEGGGSSVYGWTDTRDISQIKQEDYIVWVGMVTASVLNVRTGPGTKYGKLQAWPQLGSGNLVDVIGERKADDGKTWYYVNIQGNKGYVHSAYLRKI